MKYKRFLDTTEDRRAYHIIRCIDQDPYPEEDCYWRHYWHHRITRYEYRMYRTWKYHRKTQWKYHG